ncbi:MAG TPA: hypothetical protein PKA95_18890 [Thermomicrobiales bacterium]|nr:hypothetical protein [Thermomicrobiales bacterium]
MAERDYAKFIRPDGKLYVRRIPRPVYVEMVRAYQQRPEVVEEVFEQLYWRWDLDQAEQKAAAEGRDTNRVELAQELIAEMADDDWWKLTAAFEEHLIAGFAKEPARWAEYLDPVYDLQEAEGWRDRQ